jgi:hypothetical protein
MDERNTESREMITTIIPQPYLALAERKLRRISSRIPIELHISKTEKRRRDRREIESKEERQNYTYQSEIQIPQQ